MEGIKKFKVNTEGLSQKEKVLLEKLVSAAELINPIYLKQKNKKYPRNSFYPSDADKEEIEKAAKDDPDILDPYTMVERNKSGKLVAIPFHEKFKEELKPVVKLLKEAADISGDKSFSKYLETRANSLLNGDYKKSMITWLKTPACKISIMIGPIERYLDQMFFRKCAYQAWVGIMDEKRTKQAQMFKKMILTGQRKILPGAEKIDVRKLVIRIDQAVIYSGQKADSMPTGTNLPNNVKLMKKYGSKLTIFTTPLDLKFREDHFPIFKAIFKKDFQKPYSEEELYEASLYCILLHEIAHSLIRYKDAEKRLKDLFPVFDELYAYVLGIKACGTLLLKDALSQKELEAIIIMHIARNFTWWLDSFSNPAALAYAKGSAIAQNFYLKEGAIKEKDGIFFPDFAKLLICIAELCSQLDYYMALGNYKEAENFVKRYSSPEVFEKFSSRLKGHYSQLAQEKDGSF